MCDQFVTFFLTSSLGCDSLQVLEEDSSGFGEFFEQHLYNRIQNGSSHVNSTIRESGRRKATGPKGASGCPMAASCRMKNACFVTRRQKELFLASLSSPSIGGSISNKYSGSGNWSEPLLFSENHWKSFVYVAKGESTCFSKFG